jgi:hypothetical protein
MGEDVLHFLFLDRVTRLALVWAQGGFGHKVEGVCFRRWTDIVGLSVVISSIPSYFRAELRDGGDVNGVCGDRSGMLTVWTCMSVV